MIQTSSDYHAAIDFLTQEATIDVGDINEKMHSGEVNAIFGSIEIQLIDLYEKTRVLEDVQNYCREYVMKEITEKRQKFESKLKVIEHNADSYQEISYIACEVPFLDSNEVVRDRDGSTIPVSEIISGKIVASGQEIEDTLFKSVSKKQKKQGYPHYRDSLNELVDKRPYRAFYMLDKPVEGGINEEITISFDGVHKCNFLNIQTSNCKIRDVKYINESDVEEPAGDIYNACGVLKNAKGLKLTVCSNNYQTEKYQIDASRVKDDFWGMICEEQFRRTANMTSLYDMSQITGMAKQKQDQSDFQQAIEAWQQEKNAVDKRNLVMLQKFGGGEE
jgi:hypothetical protein